MPKTYKTEIIGYSFEELNEDDQYSIYENDNCFADMIDLEHIEDDFKETISQLFGGIDIGTYYDISNSQGSGACCVADLDVDTILNTLLNNSKCHNGRLPIALHILREKHKNASINLDSIQVVRCGPSNFYSHENTCCVEIKYTDYSFTGENPEDIDEAITTIEAELTLQIRELLTDFHGNLESFYDDASSFEAYCDIMSNNDAVYTREGKVVDPVLIKNSFIIDGYQLSLGFDDYTEHSFT